jgi:hypothetical protein
VKDWKIFDMPSLTFLSNMLTFDSNVNGITNFPINLVFYPNSDMVMQVYSRKPQPVRLIPTGFVVEKMSNKK